MLTPQVVADEVPAFLEYLSGLANAEVFAEEEEAAHTARALLLGERPTRGYTALWPPAPSIEPPAARNWSVEERRLLVGLTWPSPYATPVMPQRCLRDAQEVRAAVQRTLRRVVAAYWGWRVDLMTVIEDHRGIDTARFGRLLTASEPLDATTLIRLGQSLCLSLRDDGWSADPLQLEAAVQLYRGITAIERELPLDRFDPIKVHEAMGLRAVPPDERSRYRPLFEYLDSADGEEVVLSLLDIETLILRGEAQKQRDADRISQAVLPWRKPGRPEATGGLGRSAHSPAWWANTQDVTKRSHARAWTAAGYRTRDVRLVKGDPKRSTFTFTPIQDWAVWGPMRRDLRARMGPKSL